MKSRLFLESFLAALVGVLLSAIQWLPFLELTMQSSTLMGGGRGVGGPPQVYSADWLYHVVTAVTLMIPQFFGSPVLRNYTWPFPVFQNYTEQSYYFGLIPLAFSIFALFRRQKKGWVIFYVVFGLVSLAVAWRLPGFELLNFIPPFSLMSNKRLKMYFTFFFAILAGQGFEDWLVARGTQRRSAARIAPALIFFAASGLTGLMFMIGRTGSFLQASKIEIPGFLMGLSLNVFNLNQPTTYFPAVVALFALGLLTLFWLGKLSLTKASIGLVLWTALDLLVAGWNYNPAIENHLIFPQTSVLQMLTKEQQPYRVVGNRVLPENTGTAYQIPHVEGYDMPIYQPVSSMYYGQGGKGSDYRQRWQPDWPLVDWFNVKYYFSVEPIEMDKYRMVYQNDHFRLYENDQALPRAYLVYRYEVVSDDDQALKTILAPSFEFANKVILENPPREGTQFIPPGGEPIPNNQVVFEETGPDQVRMQVETSMPGLLVMSDIYYPGWKASVDGLDTQIIKANYAFRAVEIPAGAHKVEFSYQPASFEIGKWLTILGFVVCLSALLITKQIAR
jgi:hypothetical protein